MALDSQSPFGRPAAPRMARTDMLMRLIELFELSAAAPLKLRRDDLDRLAPEAQLRLLLSRLVEAGVLHARTSLEVLRGLVRVFDTNLNTHYAPPAAYPGKLYLVEAAERRCGPDVEERREATGWQEHLADVALWTVPGNHNTMLNAPNAGRLAQWLQALIKSLEDAQGSGPAGGTPGLR